MGDHGGGLDQLKELAKAMDAKYGPKGAHVYFCGDVYEKSRHDFEDWSRNKGLPLGNHAGLPDTSLMLYLQPRPGEWARPIYKTTPGPDVPPGVIPDEKAAFMGNGVAGDPRPATAEIGKMLQEMRVSNAVAEINKVMAAAKTSGQ